MSFLVLTIPVGLVLGAALLAFVLRAVRDGAFDDVEGAAQRHHLDDDRDPERESLASAPQEAGQRRGSPDWGTVEL